MPTRRSATSGLDPFTRGYVECALWSSTDNSTPSGGEPLDANYGVDDVSAKTLAEMKKDCRDFQESNAKDLAEYEQRRAHVRHQGEGPALAWAGHDFWLSRHGHGTGFWDRGLGALGDRLHKASKPYGSFDLYVGNDGKIHS